jgi:hypothetical protein
LITEKPEPKNMPNKPRIEELPVRELRAMV